MNGGEQSENLEALLADAVAAEAAHQRSADRLLRQAAAEEATFAGVLVDLAERGDRVAVRTAAGRVHRGVLRAVGRDFAVVQPDGRAGSSGDSRPPVFVRLAAVTSVGTVDAPTGATGAIGATGDRRPPLEASLAAVLGGLAPDRPQVQVGVAGDSAFVAGELVSAGFDVVVLRRPAAVVPVAAITEIVLLDR